MATLTGVSSFSECEAIPEILVEYRKKNYERPIYTKNQQKIFCCLGVSHLVKAPILYSENPQKFCDYSVYLSTISL